ncbi:MAG: hypothetical protein LBS88_09200 [Tannerellaceae bacterium]|jgi:hypothetical protein|nr:hypothetical protein [Tannerellaceae bacterium]
MAIIDFQNKMLQAQRAELTESKVYYRIADFEKDENNRAILLQIEKNEAFFEMVSISLGVATISFFIGLYSKQSF